MDKKLSTLPNVLIDAQVAAALREDLGRAGDITSAATLSPGATARAAIVARQDGIIAGLDLARRAFSLVNDEIAFHAACIDGEKVASGAIVASIEGPADAILAAERVALNFLGHMSGIATATGRYCEAVAHTQARITCTRKTTPGLRALEKYAVAAGGGSNHRFGLDDAILIKDNHVALCGGVAQALLRAKNAAGHMVKIEIEVDSLDQLDQVLEVGADCVLLDNMDPDTLRRAVGRVRGRVVLEASGGITLDTVAAVAETGVDYISSGWITHSAPTLDLGLDIGRQA